MNLLAISHTGLFSGAERVLLGQLTLLAQEGHAITLAAPAGALTDHAVDAGLTIVALPELKPRSWPRPLALLGLLADQGRAGITIRRLARKADVVYFNSYLALPSTAGFHLGRPTALAIHDVLLHRGRRAVLRSLSRVVDRALAVSDASGEYARSVGIDTRIVRNGARLATRESSTAFADRATNPPVVGIIGALTPWKGHRDLLEAIAIVPDVHLEVLGQPFPGDHSYAAELEERARRPDLHGRIKFLGHRSDIAAVMGRWSVSISASNEPEAGPLGVMESMALAIPMVVTDLGGGPETIGDGGILVQPGNSQAIANAITTLLADDNLWRQHSAAGLASVKAELNLGAALARFRAEILSLAAADS